MINIEEKTAYLDYLSFHNKNIYIKSINNIIYDYIRSIEIRDVYVDYYVCKKYVEDNYYKEEYINYIERAYNIKFGTHIYNFGLLKDPTLDLLICTKVTEDVLDILIDKINWKII